jgi:5'-nucleotidase
MVLATILVTNDDGIFAAGLRALVTALLAENHHVMVVAPDRERSATSHALTLHEPLRALKHKDLLDAGCTAAFAVSGTPVDCVKLAFHNLLPTRPDVVISGINHGPNLGNDIAYSGTVSAALEAAQQGQVLSLATSHTGGYLLEADFTAAAQFIARFVPKALSMGIPEHTVLNLNVPDPIDGVAVTTLSTRLYHNFYELRQDPRNKDYYWLDGRLIDSNDPPDCDTYAIKQNKVSITPVHLNWLDTHTMTTLHTHLDVVVPPGATP